jgi:glutamate racemase
VLGCTNYPFFIDTLKKILPRKVKIVNPAPAVAKQAKKVLTSLENSNQNIKNNMEPFVHFYSSGDITILKNMVNEIEEKEKTHFRNSEFKQIELK